MATLKISSDLEKVIKKVVLDTYFPVGSLYLTVGSENPNNTIGGTWTKLSGYYLYADTSINNTSYTGKHTQGHALTKGQLPNYTLYNANHGHSLGWSGGYEHLYITSGKNTIFSGMSTGSSTAYGIGGTYDNSGATNITVNSGGNNETHSHNIATKGIYVWQRTA